MIPLHVLDAIVDTTLRSTDVWSLDTDVFIDLLDLVLMDFLVHPLSSDLLRVLAPRDEYVSVFSRSVSRNAKVSLVFTTSVVRIGGGVCWCIQEDMDYYFLP